MLEAVNEKIKKNEETMAAKILQKVSTDIEHEKIRKLQQTVRYLKKTSLVGELAGPEEENSQNNILVNSV